MASLPDGEVVVLPGHRQAIAGRLVVGAAVRTEDVEASRRIIAAATSVVLRLVDGPRGRSLFVPPVVAHGLWLEFRGEPVR